MSVELLLHNVSHSDLVLSLNDENYSLENGNQAVARPKFSCFREITKLLYDSIDSTTCSISSQLKYNRYIVKTSPLQYKVSPSISGEQTPVGFRFPKNGATISDISKLRFRRDDRQLLPSSSVYTIETVNFPLLAVVVPKWLETIQYKKRPDRKYIILLITGRGTPNDTSARVVDNSTLWTGRLMAKFIERVYPFIEVKQLNSSTNIFRYDENILFVKKELVPSIDRIRDKLLAHLPKESRWKDYFRVTMSFADGSSARISAINASLKHYRPDYMHFWQLKTFWSEMKICADDVEWHSFEEISTETAMSMQSTIGTTVGEVVQEMQHFIKAFEIARSSPDNDLGSFWLRKTRKPVLAVLLVEKNGINKFYRGSNMEVSMPTGSLCAERNAIGSALVDDLTLCRQDLKMIAVYSPNSLNPPAIPLKSISIGESSSLNGNMSQEESPDLHVKSIQNLNSITNASGSLSHYNSQEIRQELLSTHFDHTEFSLSVAGDNKEELEQELSQKSQVPLSPIIGHKRKILNTSLLQNSSQSKLLIDVEQRSIFQPASESPYLELKADKDSQFISPSPNNGRLRTRSGSFTLSSVVEPKIRSTCRVLTNPQAVQSSVTYQHPSVPLWDHICDNSLLFDSTAQLKAAENDVPKLKISTLQNPPTVIQVDESDLNPIKPCGACNEWLKKIAEFNPHFSVITFTDVLCRGVYVEQIKD